MVTNGGGGYSRWRDLAVTRWREDATRDCWGTFCYLRDVASGDFWSAAHPADARTPRTLRGDLLAGTRRVPAPRRRHRDAHCEIAVSPEDDIELRRVTHHQPRAHAADDRGDQLRRGGAGAARAPTRCTRRSATCSCRPSSSRERQAHPVHAPAALAGRAAAVDAAPDGRARRRRRRGVVRDRPRAVHRSRAHRSPSRWRCTRRAAVGQRGLGARSDRRDPAPHHARARARRATIDIVTGVAETRDAALALVEKYRDRHLADRVFELAWTHSQVVLRQLDATRGRRAALRAAAPSAVLYANASLRADPSVLIAQPARAVGAVGLRDLRRPADRAAADRGLGEHRPRAPAGAGARLLAPQGAGRRPGDLERGSRRLPPGPAGPDHGADRRRQRSAPARPPGRHLRAPRASRSRTRTGSCCRRSRARSSCDRRGTLAEQVDAGAVPARGAGAARSSLDARRHAREHRRRHAPARRPRRWATGSGGFTPRRPRVRDHDHAAGQATPAPWVNVIANPRLRHRRHRERRSLHLERERARVPAHAVVQRPGQRRERRGLLPARRGDRPVLVADAAAVPRHRRLRHPPRLRLQRLRARRATASPASCAVYVATDAPVKFSVLKLRNASGRARRLSVTGYVEWVLGDLRAEDRDARRHRVDPRAARCLRATPTTPSSPAASRSSTSTSRRARVTGDRTEFLGRNGALRDARGAWRARGCRAGSARRSIPAPRCRCTFELADGEEREIVFRLGVGRRRRRRAAASCSASAARPRAQARWTRCWRTGAARSARCTWTTPDPALNLLANGWLLYQTLACRLWARSGFYQSGGAFGFRDQLQDAMALVHAEPAAAARAAPALRRPPVRRGRRPALVASAARAAACARASPTTTSGCRSRSRATSRPPATPACSTSASPFLEGRPVEPGRGVVLRPAAAARTQSARSTSTACARIRARPALRRARPAADGHAATGTTA